MTTQNEVKNDPNFILMLDHGFIGIVDSMGDDSSIVQAARVSYGKGTKNVRDDRNLIRYLLRHRHTSPFEMCEVKFHAKMPIVVARQWVRHRTASINEYSGRYSEMTDEFYIPELNMIQSQSKDNKQGRSGVISEADKIEIQQVMKGINEDAYMLYEQLLQINENYIVPELFSKKFPGVAKEIGRMILPLNNYTEWYWKANLHNIFHFLDLRMDPHAQYEIRTYARAMFDLISERFPIACEAFEDYILDAQIMSRMEMDIIKNSMDYREFAAILPSSGLSKREQEEIKNKLK